MKHSVIHLLTHPHLTPVFLLYNYKYQSMLFRETSYIIAQGATHNIHFKLNSKKHELAT